ncbi:MAG: hypothetical protein OIN87_06325 [Candidatus Methanoperedens sp.]|nr:hypothetical protein [Candidatus Methanoperedens sp.]
MSILDVTEDQIFQTLGKGRDPNFKPIEKVRPVVIRPKKTYPINTRSKTIPSVKPVQPIEAPAQEMVIALQNKENDETIKRLTEDIIELNSRVSGLQNKVKWYMVPQTVAVLILLLVIVVQANP